MSRSPTSHASDDALFTQKVSNASQEEGALVPENTEVLIVGRGHLKNFEAHCKKFDISCKIIDATQLPISESGRIMAISQKS